MSDGPQDGEESSVWDRLRRRKVVQWGIAYAAGAWGLLQGLQFLAEAFEWPSRILKLGTVAAVLGLPVALALAWFRGERGAQRFTRTELAVVTLLFLIGGGLFWHYHRTSATPEPQVAAQSAPPSGSALAALPTDRSIAVLPFVNMSEDKEQEYFADGISEELLNLLAQVPELRVIARTSSFAFKGKDVGIAEIAQKLNVAHVLEGSVRRSGDTLRITAQLIRTSDSSHLWSETYDRQMTDVFKVQDEIAAAVVDQLKIKLLGHAPESKATDPKAYALFLQARDVFRQGSTDASVRSRELYQQALAIDSTYPAAWVGLADTYIYDVTQIVIPADEGVRLAREAIEKALALDPEFGEAHATLGVIAFDYDRNLAAAARRLERAMALEPSNQDIIGDAATLFRRLGRLDHAIALGKYQVSLDPVNADGRFQLGLAYRYAGRLDESLEEFRTVLSLTPGRAGVHETIGGVLLQKGDAQAALHAIQEETADQWRLPALSVAYYALGRKPESDAALEDLISKYGAINAEVIAAVFAFRGEADRAFEWLNKAADNQEAGLTSIAAYPWYDRIHSDPRWLPFLRRIGIAPEQLAAIEFEVKLPE